MRFRTFRFAFEVQMILLIGVHPRKGKLLQGVISKQTRRSAPQ
jgi:hypothetical protein